MRAMTSLSLFPPVVVLGVHACMLWSIADAMLMQCDDPSANESASYKGKVLPAHICVVRNNGLSRSTKERLQE